MRTLQQLQTMNPGFDTQNGLTMSFDLGYGATTKRAGNSSIVN